MKNLLLLFCLAGFSAEVIMSCDKNPAPNEESINLTDNFQYANSFIIEKSGRYSFETSHVDGTRIDGGYSANWLWSTIESNDPQALLRDVSYENGKIYFTASEKKGNALIALFNSTGSIIWSWHIWMTDRPADQTVDNGTTFMDRNLGAVSSNPKDSSATYGLKYQWGRKDPFYGGDSNETDDGKSSPKNGIFSKAIENTIVNTSLSEDNRWESVLRSATVGTPEYATANPMQFIYSLEDERDWMWTADNNLWLNEPTGSKTNYDPCPYGYHVPSDDAWSGCGYWNVEDDNESGGRIWNNDNGTKVWYPLTGARWGDKDAGRLGYVGKGGSEAIWKNTTKYCGFNAGAFYLLQGSYVSNGYAMYRAHGISVRCAKE